MEDNLHIGEVAELFGLPRATLRFWQNQGLLPEQREENGYRRYSLLDLIALSDVIYYRDLDLPIKEIRTIRQKNVVELDELLQRSCRTIEAEILRLQEALQKTQWRRQLITRAHALERTPYMPSPLSLRRIVHFDFSEPNKLNQYLTRPDFYIEVIPKDDLEHPLYGIDADANPAFKEEPTLWERPTEERLYLSCLLKSAGGWSKSNLPEHLERLNAMGRKTGFTVCQYLFSTYEASFEKFCDYFEAWIEIEP